MGLENEFWGLVEACSLPASAVTVRRKKTLLIQMKLNYSIKIVRRARAETCLHPKTWYVQMIWTIVVL
jgi:hypothetical protein